MKKLEKKYGELLKNQEQWEEEKKYILKKQKIKSEKKKLLGIKHPSTSKLLTFFLFLNCSLIEIFTGYIVIQNIQVARELMMSPDLTPLTALIGAIVGETIGFAIYSIKAAKENCKGGIVYEQAMKDVQQMSNEDIVG